MTSNRRLAAALVFAAFLWPSVSMGQTLDLPGSYGAASGCNFADQEDFDLGVSLLTNERLRAGDVDCEILNALRSKNGAFALTMMCNRRSERRTSIDFFLLAKVSGADAYQLADQTGKVLGTLTRCPR